MIHVFHPALVHFSIAFLVFGALCEAAGLLCAWPRVARFGNTLVLLGTASLPVAIVTGYTAANSLPQPTAAAADLLWRHERNGWIVLGLFLACLFWKAWNRGELPGARGHVYTIAVLGAAAFTVFGAYLGAEMVYRYGVGVIGGTTP